MTFNPSSYASPARGAGARYAAARSTYTADAVQTVTPAQLVVMMYDALVNHLDIAVTAIGAGDLADANQRLIKCQGLIFELEVGLNTELWPGGAGLRQLYSFLTDELVEANLSKSPARIRACRDLIAPLAEAWRQAATSAGATMPTAAPAPAVSVSIRS